MKKFKIQHFQTSWHMKPFTFVFHDTMLTCCLSLLPHYGLFKYIYIFLILPYFVDFCMLGADVSVKKINNKIIERLCKQIYDNIRISKAIMAKDSKT